jgi:hypothetical protein
MLLMIGADEQRCQGMTAYFAQEIRRCAQVTGDKIVGTRRGMACHGLDSFVYIKTRARPAVPLQSHI